MFAQRLKCLRNSGLTLIEVLASLMLMSMLMGLVLHGFRQLQQQVTRSTEVGYAVEVADALMMDWNADGIPVNTRGYAPRLGEQPGGRLLEWRTSVWDTRHRQSLGIDLVRVQLFGVDSPKSPLVSFVVASPCPEWSPHSGEF